MRGIVYFICVLGNILFYIYIYIGIYISYMCAAFQSISGQKQTANHSGLKHIAE